MQKAPLNIIANKYFSETCQVYVTQLVGALSMDISKAFDSVSHDLLLAKLNAYGSNLNALQLLRNYLSKRHQRVKVNSTFSDWKEVKSGVSQGSVLRPLFFNVFVICSYADDTTIFACHPTLETIIRRLGTDSNLLAKWFSDNYLKLNDDKCYLMIFSDKYSKATVTIRNSTINQNEYEKLLGVNFDKKLSSESMLKICAKRPTKNSMHLIASPSI